MKTNVKKEITRYIYMIISSFIYALSLSLFFVPAKIVAGGVSGFSIILNYLFPILTVGTFNALINLPILLFGLKSEGWKFILRCLLTVACISVFTDLTAFLPPITDDRLLCALYGGAIQGIAIGLFCKYSVSSGGTELLGRMIYKKIKLMPMVYYIYIVDAFIIVFSAIVYKSPENLLYALIVIFISAYLSDRIVVGFETAKMVYIITDKADEIGDFLVKNSPRGVSNFTGQGVYSKKTKNMLITVVKKNQLIKLKEWVSALDENAFVIVSDTTEVLGKGFKGIKEEI